MSELQTRPVVITGCLGFVGTNLALQLAARGCRVVGIDSPSALDWRWRSRSLSNVESVRLDLCREVEVRAFVEQTQPVAIFNCAAYGAYAVQHEAQRIWDVNVLAVRHLLEAVRGVAGFKAFVQAGTSSEYGFNCSGPSEDGATEPDSDYAVSKVAATGLVRLYARQHGVPAFVLRLYSVYGPFEDFSRLIPVLLEAAAEGRFPPLVTPSISRDFVYVADVVQAFEAVLARAPELAPGDVFNIGSGVQSTLAELVSQVRTLFGVQTEPVWGGMPERSWDHAAWFGNPAKAAAVLGWRAASTLPEGLVATRAWLGHNCDLLAEGRANTVLRVSR